MDRRTDKGDNNIPFAFLKKRGDKHRDMVGRIYVGYHYTSVIFLQI